MRKNWWLAMTLASASVVLIPSFGDERSSSSAGPGSAAPKELAGFEERWTSAMRELDIAGMGFVVVRGDRVVYRASIGLRDVDRKLPVTSDTAFYIGSSTKLFIAMAVAALAEEGKIELDAPVKKYLPRFEISDAALSKALTVRDLLTHAKGVDSDMVVFLDAYTGDITEDRYYRWLKEATASGAPAYSNVHYTLLGRIIEIVTEKRWQDYLAERLFIPAGMRSSTCFASKLYAGDNVAIPTEWKDGKFGPCEVRKTDRTMHAAGGTGASIDDLARFMIVNLNGGAIEGKQIVPSQAVADMQRMHVIGGGDGMPYPQKKREGFGFGWSIGKLHVRTLLERGGDYVGSAAMVAMMPEEKIGVAVLSNTGGPHAQLATMEILSRLLGEQVEDRVPKLKTMFTRMNVQRRERESKLSPPPGDGAGLPLPATSYAGSYINNEIGTLTITARSGALQARLGDLPCRLSIAGENQFAMALPGESIEGAFDVADGAVRAVALRFGRIPDPIEFRRQSP